MHSDEVFIRNMVGLLNKRGYNVRDSALETSIVSSNASFTRSSSLTSSGSTVSSVLLALREPNHGQTPLHIAVRKGDTHVLDALLEHESVEELIDAPDFNGNTALHFAAGNWRQPQCMNITERLLEAGADVNAQNKRGLTPLAVHMLTLKIDNPTLVLKLLEAGSDPNTEAEGVAVLHVAARRNLPAVSGVLCLKPSSAVTAIPFVRKEEDAEPGNIKTCRLCEAILLDCKRKQASQHAFDMHVMGFKTSI
ncbi:hypothetical protein BBJ29_002464 [Phytophthora kernoviae]|uniref:Uncharacterized protein n=1 Tax=Phytophthora kernoviae TaxID=325452 RepID=A0A3F2RYM5_9STRA|nr:hypothetical protein BBJ29_002464 [Phytophthora kernoviae]RLN66837.1 hypothetical protein BBP00_00001982 [Phytophthora kernoviae]